MKKIISVLALLFLCLAARANIYTAIVTITNIPPGLAVITNGSDVRTWTNAITTNASQILITNCACATTNIDNANALFNAAAVYPFSAGTVQVTNTPPTTSNVTFTSQSPIVFTVSSGWCSIAYFTNTTTPGSVVSVPFTSFPAATRTNWASGLVSGIDANSTNSFSTNDTALSKYVPLNGLFAGTFSNGVLVAVQSLSGIMGNVTNGTWTGASLTNGQNFGNPFRSPGGGTGSEQFGLFAQASTNYGAAFGDHAHVNDLYGVAVGYGATVYAGAPGSTAVGYNSAASNSTDTAYGSGALAEGGFSTAIGAGTTAAYTNSSAIGTGASTTTPNQVAIGYSGISVWIPGQAQIDGGVSNLNSISGSTVTLRGKLLYPRFNNTSLANGANAAVSWSTNRYVKLSGPSGAFSIAGVAAGSDDQEIILQNSTGQTMTISNDSGTDPTAANRIYTGTGADIVLASNPGFVCLKYEVATTHWLVVSAH